MSFNSKKILIVGGTGFIGYFLAKKFSKLNFKVYSLSKNKPSQYRKLLKVKYLFGDISNLLILKKLLKKKQFDYVINCGGYVEHFNKLKVYKNHYIGCKNLYKIFKKKNICLFLQIGSSSEYGSVKVPHKEDYKCSPSGIYGKAKLMSTKFFLKKFKETRFPVSILRPYQIYGPNQSFNRFIPQLIKSSIEKKKFVTSEGKQFRDFLFIEDFVRAVVLLINNKKKICGKIINIGYGKPIKLKNIMNLVKKENNYFNPDYGKIKIRADEKKIVYPDIKRLKAFIKWKPKFNIKKGIKITNKYYLKNINNYK